MIFGLSDRLIDDCGGYVCYECILLDLPFGRNFGLCVCVCCVCCACMLCVLYAVRVCVCVCVCV